MHNWKRFVMLLAVSVLTGCGGDGLNRVPIQGVLTAGGEPVDGATVQFIGVGDSTSPGAIGNTDAQGKFTVISSREGDEGIPPGEYTVRVTRLVDGTGKPLPPNAAEADYPDSKESIPPPYSGMSSPLKATVSESGGEIKLDIPKKLGTGKK